MSAPHDLLALAHELAIFAALRGNQGAAQLWLAAAEYLGAGHPGDETAVRNAVAELQSSGWVHREQAIAELPVDLRWLFDAGLVTVRDLQTLALTLDVATHGDLHYALAAGRATPLREEVAAQLAAALSRLDAALPRIPIGRALALLEPMLERVGAEAGVSWAMTSGSLRRGLDLVRDVEVIVCTDDPERAVQAVADADGLGHISLRTPQRLVVSMNRTELGWRFCRPPQATATLLCATGSRAHVAELQAIAAARRLRLTPEGLFGDRGQVKAESETAIYAALGLPWIAPELREDGDEIARARAGALPDLVERDDLFGDLHTHTSWSDGRDTIEAMVTAAIGLGYRYLAITDHSPSSAAAKNLSVEDVGKQAEEIARLRERYPQISILHGCEVDILPDGQLDFPDKLLRRFDIVLASLHDRAGQSPQQLLRRYLAAMIHPLVNIITHPANRAFTRAPGYDIDYDRLFEAAVETRTALEIDGAPSHVDMEASLARRAIARGVTVTISSDSHGAHQLRRYMDIGLLTARRAGVERRSVLNSRPLPEIRAWITGKRSRSQP